MVSNESHRYTLNKYSFGAIIYKCSLNMNIWNHIKNSLNFQPNQLSFSKERWKIKKSIKTRNS